VTRYVVVTGTDTGVGKTVATAALAAGLAAAGARPAVVKPVQTGLGPEERGSDADVVRALAGIRDVHELVRLREPLAPDTAARLEGRQLPSVAELAAEVRSRTARADVVLVEGAGGVRVRLDSAGGTLLDLASALAHTSDVGVVVVVRAGLGTLNHTELTVDAVRAAKLTLHGLVVGAWPAEPDLAARCNLDDLPAMTWLPVLALLTQGCGSWEPDVFAAAGWFGDWPHRLLGERSPPRTR
jgi:dethiobiotin synthase